MFRILGRLLPILLLFAASCVKEPAREEPPVETDLVFSASFAYPYVSRTSLQEDGKVFWNPREIIHVFHGTEGGPFTSTNDEAAAVASFEGTLTLAGDGPFLAVYPYDRQDVRSPLHILPAVPIRSAACRASGNCHAKGPCIHHPRS